ncbi:MAG: nitrogen regulation protein NR(II) [Gemmataceae bacterium]
MSHHDAELAEMAGGFIHEIKNHLGTLGLNLQLLAEDFAEPENQRERRALTRVLKLQSQCQHLVDVSNDFLRFARIKDLNLVSTDLNKIVEDMIDFYGPTAQASSIQITSFLPADLPHVWLDEDLFRQALLNLMLNASQAMPDGGKLTIQAAVEPNSTTTQLDADDSTTRSSGPMLALHLIDTGKGMELEVLSKIFEPFYSTKKTGSGLGLPTTKRIIEAHRGTIFVESEAGRGTKFTIHLPIQDVNGQDPPAQDVDSSGP